MADDYKPIACGAYDELEVMAMRRTAVELTCRDDRGACETLSGRVIDTLIRAAAEYLVLDSDGRRHQIRLDRIVQIDDPVTGKRWRQYSDNW